MVIKLLQDIVCHGVPSPKVWKKYLEQFNIEEDANISFRDKSTGWDSYSFTILSSQNEYMKVFFKIYV